MRIGPFNISLRKNSDDISHWSEAEGGWWPVIREGYAGAWQQNITLRRETLIAFTPVYACMTRIAQDIGKMPIQLMEKVDKIWVEVERNSPYGPVIYKPNDYQSQSQFLQQWMISKLLAGNTYILKHRDNRGIVTKLYPLDPTRVRPLITPDGSIFYSLSMDPLSEVFDATEIAPASEIIHDRMPGIFHPLIGTSPLFACSLPAIQGHAMQKSSASFFKNMAQPSGVLTAPGAISNETAARLKTDWAEKFSGRNVGRVAVLGDGLKFEPVTITAAAAQQVEQLRLTAEMVCSAFGVPSFMVGVTPPPTYTNIEAMTQQYWSQCLQAHMEGIECGITEGLGLYEAGSPTEMCIKLGLDVLLRMDTATRYTAWKNAVSGGWMSPNEVRAKENLPDVEGGGSPYLQVQNYSLEALAARDAAGPPVTPGAPAPAGPPAAPAEDSNAEDPTDAEDAGAAFGKYFSDAVGDLKRAVSL